LEDADAQGYVANVRAFGAMLAFEQGDLGAARQWLAGFKDVDATSPWSWVANQRVIAARILIGSERPAEALPLLDRFVAMQRAVANPALEALGLAVTAVALEAVGKGDDALEAIARAVDAAERGGVSRRLIDLGDDVEPLLQRLVTKHGGASGYLATLLEAFREMAPNGSDSGGMAIASALPAAGQSDSLAERVTSRELQVLEGLDRRLSNKEIADELFISPLTVKRHSINLYGKLDVSSRRQAVLKARALGLLPAG
jgi:LuxR family maltose regulon positive regulatory protein